MKEPTGEEIQAEIDLLHQMKPTVLRMSKFEENHHDAIDAQIKVLEDRLDEDGVDEEYGDGQAEDNVRSAATDAARWLIGDLEDEDGEGPNLSDRWKSLVVKEPEPPKAVVKPKTKAKPKAKK